MKEPWNEARTHSLLWLLALSMLSPLILESQSARDPHTTAAGTLPEMSAENIFNRFARRILLLTCDEGDDESSLASGVLVSDDGFIVTNAHVVGQCLGMRTTYIDGAVRRSYEPVLKYYDDKHDIAVLKITDKGLSFFRVQATPVRIGERVFAIGNPRGLEQSISEGIVSGNREVEGVAWIQHSAPISPGSSGGALISARGELLGINSRFRIESQNLNFAVPAETLAGAISSARRLSGIVEFPPSPEAQLKLGVRYLKGEGDDGRAAAWVRKAAGQNNADAQLRLGLLYYEGRGVEKDYAQAAAWIRKAAEQGNTEAEANLGATYARGWGVPQDYVQAGVWFHKAADQGHAFAQRELGALYSEGRGVPQDFVQAAAWTRRAAEQGDATAQAELGADYLLGEGIPKDYSEAYFWFRIAEAGTVYGIDPRTGHEITNDEMTALLTEAATHLTPGAVSEAEARAAAWLAASPKNVVGGYLTKPR